MKTTARVIQCACEVGLILCGKDEDNSPEWLGTQKQFESFNNLLMGEDLCAS